MGEEPAAAGGVTPALSFTPRPAPSWALVRRYAPARLEPALGREADALAELFMGRGNGQCEQAEWMGRGCFRRLGPGRYLAAKGIGPGPRSEALRHELDASIRRATGGHGGCLRLPTGTRWPLLVKFQQVDDGWEAVDPRPEGFSMLGDTARDAESALLDVRLGGRSLRPLLLLRDRQAAPWGGEAPEELERWLLERLPAAIAEHLARRGTSAPPIEGLRLRGLYYRHLDGGLLIRAAASPYRVADLHTAAVQRDLAAHADLSAHLARRLGGPADPGLTFGLELARTGALLSAHGVLHGQLGLHYQNVTLAAELADFDSVVAVRAADADLSPVPFPEPAPAVSRALRRYRAGLARAAARWGVAIAPGLATDLRQLAGISGGDLGDLDEERLAAAFLLQLYELHLHALRIADLLERRPGDLERPGTVLDADRVAVLRQAFAAEVAAGLARLGALGLARWYLARGRERLLDDRLDRRGWITIYGWTSPDVPLDHAEAVVDDARQAWIRQEAAELCAAVAAAVGGREVTGGRT